MLENGKKVATIKTLHDGMGRFAVTPKSGREYKVVLDDGRTIPFPTIASEGLALRIAKNNSKGISLLVSSSNDTPQAISITAKQNGTICSTAKGTLKGQQIVKLPIDYFAYHHQRQNPKWQWYKYGSIQNPKHRPFGLAHEWEK